uniref:RNase H type-1 domain-containing protein n=2 Tax=Timema TaxID=61471 RepID=A0A7R9NW09_9NEOP|nr:unnamed protein product [Timema bartmani]CAD7458299.1 unnamed protein product [Timema tahoe]
MDERNCGIPQLPADPQASNRANSFKFAALNSLRSALRDPGLARTVLGFPRWVQSSWGQPTDPPTTIYTDATPWTVAAVNPEVPAAMVQNLDQPIEINSAEITAVLLGTFWEIKERDAKNIRIGTNSATACYAALTGKGITFNNTALRRLHLYVMNIAQPRNIHTFWVPTEINPADEPSRRTLRDIIEEEAATAGIFQTTRTPYDRLSLLYL